MASLVAYDDSGSDISDSDEDQNTRLPSNDQNNVSNNHTSNNIQSDPAELFLALPKPRESSCASNVFEEDDEFLHKKENPLDVPAKPPPATNAPGKKIAQIFLPSLSSFNDDEDDEQTHPSVKFKQSTKGTGLLSLLPKPKSAQIIEEKKKKPVTSLIPDSVKNKCATTSNVSKKSVVNKTLPGSSRKSKESANVNSSVQKVEKSKVGLSSSIKYDSSDDESDTETNGEKLDFFSLNKVDEEFVSAEIELNPAENIKILETDNNLDNMYPNAQPSLSDNTAVDYIGEPHVPYYEIEADSSSAMSIDAEALQKLAGSRAKRRGETMEIIDINQKEILPDPRVWLTKALTEDTTKRTSASKRRGEEPTTQQRRKHQITYLAHQAKANEQELQNQWANNRLSKKQTQSKYGF